MGKQMRRILQGVLVGERKRSCGNCPKWKMGEFFFHHSTIQSSLAWKIGRIFSGLFLLIPIVSDYLFYVFYNNVSNYRHIYWE